MNIEFVRFTDRWVGTLACRLLSLWERIRSLLPRPPHPRPQNILIIEISEMGSVLLAYTMIRELRSRYPESKLYFLVFEKIRESVDILEVVPRDHVITLDDSGFLSFTASAVRAVFRMRALAIDTVLDMELFARISAILSYLSGAGNRVGFHRYNMEGLYRGQLLTHRVQYSPHQHMGKNQMALLDALAEPSTMPLVKNDYSQLQLHLPRLEPAPVAGERVRARLGAACPGLGQGGRVVLLSPGGGELPIRAWPLENYVTLTKRLLEIDDVYVGVIGLPSDRRWYEQMAGQISSSRFFNFAGETATVRELIELFDCCDVLVTSDGGPAHFAGLSSIHCVAFFGPETPVLYGPIGSNCSVLYAGISCSPCLTAYNHRNSPCDGDNICIKGFEPEHVYQIVTRALQK